MMPWSLALIIIFFKGLYSMTRYNGIFAGYYTLELKLSFSNFSKMKSSDINQDNILKLPRHALKAETFTRIFT
jgi:hypothetical protein